jgi:hypothetical protein
MHTGTRRIRPGGLLTIGAALLMACGRSAEAKAHDAAQQLRSWDATEVLLDRLRAAVPEQFAAQIRRAAAEARPRAEAQLREARSP